MTLLTRLSRLFKADIHGILDSLEEPEIILKQAVRDMQNELDQAAATISVLAKQQERLQQQRHSLSRYIEELQQHLNFCFSENNEVLAKSVIRKKLQAELSLKELSRQLDNISQEKNQYIVETEQRTEKLQAIRDKLALVSEHNEFDETARFSEPNSTVNQDDIELAFLYEKQRYTGSTGTGAKS